MNNITFKEIIFKIKNLLKLTYNDIQNIQNMTEYEKMKIIEELNEVLDSLMINVFADY